jgi:hypothetical protein
MSSLDARKFRNDTTSKDTQMIAKVITEKGCDYLDDVVSRAREVTGSNMAPVPERSPSKLIPRFLG